MRTRTTFTALTLTALAAGLLLVGAASAQPGFRPDSTWILEVDDATVDAEIYRAQSPAAMLIMSDGLPEPVMLTLGAGSVNGVQLMKLARQGDGSVNVLANPFTNSYGTYQVDGAGVTFSVAGRRVEVLPKPPLTGFQQAADLVAHDASYGELRDAYQPTVDGIARLSAAPDTTIRIFFGSWCPACGQLVPRVLKVEEALGDGSPVQFEYYGLPRGFVGDVEASKYDVSSVPTAVVLRDGQMIAKLGTELAQPETALAGAMGR